MEGELSRRSRWLALRMLLGGLIVFVFTGGAIAAAGLLQVEGVAKEFLPAPFKKDTITKAPPGKPQTILLVGSDHRHGDGAKDARSDTMMLVRIDPRQKAVTMMSIPRDLAVEIPGRGLAKINETYTIGGLDLTTRVIKDLLSTDDARFHVNHAVATTFSGFVDAINHLHCVYIDVDRRYYHTNAGLPQSAHWSEIDVRAGYQQLCGTDALAYVRFRHLDNDIVRAARQQSFLRATKDQLREQGTLNNLPRLVKIVGRATEADDDLRSSKGLLRLGHIAVDASGLPVRQIRFPATFVAPGSASSLGAHPELGAYVTASKAQIRKAVAEFLHPSAQEQPAKTPKKKKKSKTKKKADGPDGLRDVTAEAEALVAAVPARKATKMPVYIPTRIEQGSSFPANTSLAPNPRRYVITDPNGNRHAAYRIVIAQDASQGQYYGIQGTKWRTPPILASRHTTRTIGGRRFDVYSDGGHIRMVAWRAKKSVFWLANTLSVDLTDRQMLDIAASTRRVRGK